MLKNAAHVDVASRALKDAKHAVHNPRRAVSLSEARLWEEAPHTPFAPNPTVLLELGERRTNNHPPSPDSALSA